MINYSPNIYFYKGILVYAYLYLYFISGKMDEKTKTCTLAHVNFCKHAGEPYQEKVSTDRIKSINDASKTRRDNLKEHISQNESSVKFHRDCISTYTSKTNLERIKKKRQRDELTEARKAKNLRSDEPVDPETGEKFNFRKHCLYSLDVHECKPPNEYPKRQRRAGLDLLFQLL